jgi:hypothetical protein
LKLAHYFNRDCKDGFSPEEISEKSLSPMAKKSESPIPIEQIDETIHTIRGVRVILDRDLAKIYGVPHIPLQ